MKLPPPATGVELYLAAIHEVLCDIRTALVGGQPEPPAQVAPGLSVTPTKRTRQRPPRGS